MTLVNIHAQFFLPDDVTPDSGSATFAPVPYLISGATGLFSAQTVPLDANGYLGGPSGAPVAALDTAGYYLVTLALSTRRTQGTLAVLTSDAPNLNLLARLSFAPPPALVPFTAPLVPPGDGGDLVAVRATFVLPDDTPDAGRVSFTPVPWGLTTDGDGVFSGETFTLDSSGRLGGVDGVDLVALGSADYYIVTLDLRGRAETKGTLVLVNGDAALGVDLLARINFLPIPIPPPNYALRQALLDHIADTIVTDHVHNGLEAPSIANYVPTSGGRGPNDWAWAAQSSGVALSDLTPLIESGSGAPGTGGTASRTDHVHPAFGGGGGTTDTDLRDWTRAEAYTPTSVVYSGFVVSSAVLVWPDGSAGAFITDTVNATYQAIDAFHVTHTASGHTLTQNAVTRNSQGSVTAVPDLVLT